MAVAVYSKSQWARAASLLEIEKMWTRGTRKSDGLPIVLFPSSKPGHAYYTSSAGCTCKGYFHRGACAHVLALDLLALESDLIETRDRIDADVDLAFAALALSKRGPAAAGGVTLIRRYEELFGSDD